MTIEGNKIYTMGNGEENNESFEVKTNGTKRELTKIR